MSIISMLASVFGIISAVAMFPQVYRIFKRRSAQDISIVSYLFLLITGVIWVLYALEIQSYPLLIPQIIGNIALVLIIIGCILYGR